MNCIRNYPWYKGWQESFAEKGLVVLGIHTPEGSSEHELDNVRRAAAESGLTFPILLDNEKLNWNAWGNSMWPSVYLIDQQGYVRYWWYGELNWQGAEGEKLLRKRIEEMLADPIRP
ncbi:MAG: redoxin domain-containing protein [Pirellulales bacterium]|nr:redoxin domain-containing protein [Pirellulales bacterium]